MQITNSQIRSIHALFSKNDITDKEHKKEAIKRFTNDQITSTKDLQFDQANELIKLLGGKIHQDPEHQINKKYGWINKNDNQDFLIVSILHQLGWSWDENPKLVDVTKLGRFIRYNTKIGKPLQEMNPIEKSKLINHLNAVLNNTCS